MGDPEPGGFDDTEELGWLSGSLASEEGEEVLLETRDCLRYMERASSGCSLSDSVSDDAVESELNESEEGLRYHCKYISKG